MRIYVVFEEGFRLTTEENLHEYREADDNNQILDCIYETSPIFNIDFILDELEYTELGHNKEYNLIAQMLAQHLE